MTRRAGGLGLRWGSWALAGALAAAATAAVACGDSEEPPPSTDSAIQREPIDFSDLQEFGFDARDPAMTAEAREGLRTLFAGIGFRMFVRDSLFTNLITLEEQRQWQVYGNPPSPRSRRNLSAIPGGAGVEVRDARGINAGKDVGTSYAVLENNGKQYFSFTCFQCHAGVVAGMQVAGLGNSHIDQVALDDALGQYKQFRDLYRNDLSSLGQGLLQLLVGFDEEDREHLKWFTLYSETILRPALKGARSRGDDFGPYPVWQLLTRFADPQNRGFDLRPLDDGPNEVEALVAKTPLGPVDRRPWWLRKHDTKSYVYGDTLTEPRAGKDFSINFFVPHAGANETYKERAQEIARILAFALWSKSPPYPYYDGTGEDDPRHDPRAPEGTLEEGRGLYNQSCARCHGTVDPNPAASSGGPKWILRYKSQAYTGQHAFWKERCLPDILYSTDKDEAGHPVDTAWTEDTDLTYSCALMRFNNVANYAAGINPFFARPEFGIAPEWRPEVYNPERPGYRAPPLVGIWASAPYLHNGSLPTLGDLFEHEDLRDNQGSAPRPLGWSRVLEVSKDLSYDSLMVGMQVEPYFRAQEFPRNPGLPVDDKRQVDFRRFYDTTQPGKFREGARTCGSGLNQVDRGEKDKVIAFLKELSDNNVAPDDKACPHAPKPRERNYTGGPGYSFTDHPLCKAFYQRIGVSTL